MLVHRLLMPPLLLGAIALSAIADHAAGTTPEQDYALALEAQTGRDTDEMLARLRASARGGHVPAQTLLGVLLLDAPGTRCEARQWLGAAADAGSEVARFHRRLFERQQRGQAGERCA